MTEKEKIQDKIKSLLEITASKVFDNKLLNFNFVMAPFYGQGSPASRLHSHCEETAHFFPRNS